MPQDAPPTAQAAPAGHATHGTGSQLVRAPRRQHATATHISRRRPRLQYAVAAMLGGQHRRIVNTAATLGWSPRRSHSAAAAARRKPAGYRAWFWRWAGGLWAPRYQPGTAPHAADSLLFRRGTGTHHAAAFVVRVGLLRGCVYAALAGATGRRCCTSGMVADPTSGGVWEDAAIQEQFDGLWG